MKYKYLYPFILFSLTVKFLQAQNEKSHQRIPVLNGHKFLSTSQMKSAFISTNLQTDIGYGSTSLIKIPGFDYNGANLFSFQGKILYVDFKLQYQQQFTDWLGLFISMKLSSRIGSDLSTIIADGVNTVSGGDIGWIVKIKETDKLLLSATIKANNLTGNFIDVTKYLEDLIDGEPYPSLSKKIQATSVGLGIRGAYAFNKTYGVQFNADALHGESMQRGTTDTYYSIGILGDIDFYENQNIPLALALGYSISSTPEISMNDRGFSNIFLGKLGYSGSDDYELGLQFSTYQVNLKSVESNTRISKAMLGIKFYF